MSSCALPVWVRDGSTEEDFLTDRGACQAQAFSVSNPQLMQQAMVFEGCMNGKGWRKKRP